MTEVLDQAGACYELSGRKSATRAISRCIHDSLHFMQYITERVRINARFRDAFIYLEKLKAFLRVNHQYLEAVLKEGGSGIVSLGFIAAMHSGT